MRNVQKAYGEAENTVQAIMAVQVKVPNSEDSLPSFMISRIDKKSFYAHIDMQENLTNKKVRSSMYNYLPSFLDGYQTELLTN